MDLRAQLLKEHSRSNTERIAQFVGEDAHRFRALMNLMLANEPLVAQRAAYAVNIACEACPGLVKPYVRQLLDVLQRPVHEGVQRNSIRIMQFCDLPKNLHGRITQEMFDRIGDPRRAIAQRAFAITVGERMVRLYPELQGEFRQLLANALRTYPGPAVRSRAIKALTALDRSRRLGITEN